MKTAPKRELPQILSERQREEYDRFGPWAYPVRSRDEMPPRFDPWYEELKDSTLIIKLPREIERREAKPGSDLYVKLLAVGKEGIIHLSLTRDGISRQDFSFDRIAALRLAQELLHGELRIDLASGKNVVILFNTVSADLIEGFIDAVRAGRALGLSQKGPRLSPARRAPEPEDENILFKNLLVALRERIDGLTLMAYQPPRALAGSKGGQSGLGGVLARLLRWKLDGCLVAGTASELVLLVRGTGMPRLGKSKGYRYEEIYLSAHAIGGVSVEPRTLANGLPFFALRIKVEGCDYELLFEDDPSFLVEELSARAST